jgi:GNAT superfamily N-acetyltransferase
LLRTAYVDAVATLPEYQRRGIGTAVMRYLASVVTDCDIACLETELGVLRKSWLGGMARGAGRAIRWGLDPDA